MTEEKTGAMAEAKPGQESGQAGERAGAARRSSRGPGARAAWASQEAGKEAKAAPVRNLRFHAKKLIAREFSEIMESMAEKSKAGSLAHAKFLFEIGGVKEDLSRGGRRGKREPSIADLLRGGIKLRQEANAAELAESQRAGDESDVSDGEEADRDEGGSD